MGNEVSGIPVSNLRPYETHAYTSIGGSVTSNTKRAGLLPDHLEQPVVNQSCALLRTMYHGIWSMIYPASITPSPRTGQCSVYDEENDRLIIAYGMDHRGAYLNDAWALDLKSNEWKRLSSALLSPREGCAAALVGRKMFVFGGAMEHEVYADPHVIDIDTGECKPFSLANEPSPRVNAIFAAIDSSLYLWSGENGRILEDMYELGPNTNGWSNISANVNGRSGAAHCIHNGVLYVFGAFKGQGLMSFDPVTKKFEPVQCIGTEPSQDLTKASLISADEFLFLIGGESHSEHMHIFALEVKRKWWFAFHIRPDNETLSVSDGVVNKIGLFMLPREHSASVVYRKSTRELISVLGSRFMNPPPSFRIGIGVALASMHIRSDMLEIIVVEQKAFSRN